MTEFRKRMNRATTWSVADAVAILDYPRRLLMLLLEQDCVAPIDLHPGRGHQRRLSFDELVELAIAVEFHRHGMAPRSIRAALAALRECGFERKGHIFLFLVQEKWQVSMDEGICGNGISIRIPFFALKDRLSLLTGIKSHA